MIHAFAPARRAAPLESPLASHVVSKPIRTSFLSLITTCLLARLAGYSVSVRLFPLPLLVVIHPLTQSMPKTSSGWLSLGMGKDSSS